MVKEWLNKVVLGDNLALLKQLPDNCVDCVVTDPPSGIAFMNMEWDKNKGGKAEWIKWLTSVMVECLRVLKPGGHMVCWALPRTSHWTADAIEDAGFELRDCLTHIFSTGFPKSRNISADIDEINGVSAKVIGKSLDSANRTKTTFKGAEYKKGFTTEPEGERFITEPSSDTAKQFSGYGTSLKPAAEFWWLCRKPISEKTIAENVLKWGTGGLNIDGCRISHKETQRTTNRNNRETANVFNDSSCGFDNTQNKIASADSKGRFPTNISFSHHPECRVVGMKSVPSNGAFPKTVIRDRDSGVLNKFTNAHKEKRVQVGNSDGNETIEDFICHPDCPIKQLNDQTGIRKSGMMKAGQQRQGSKGKGGYHGDFPDTASENGTYGDEGYVSRFFYCSKPSPFERNIGLVGEGHKVNDGRQTPIDNAFQRGETERLNTHCTVKSVTLMRYLVKLLRPPKGGIVLDPFMGSGTTGMAAILENMDFIGMENVEEYKNIADQRIEFVRQNKDLILREGIKPEIIKKVKVKPDDGLKKVFG